MQQHRALDPVETRIVELGKVGRVGLDERHVPDPEGCGARSAVAQHGRRHVDGNQVGVLEGRRDG